MAFTPITVTRQYATAGGLPASGKVRFTPTAPMTNGTTVISATVVATLDTSGMLLVSLAANDDLATSPVGTSYLVREELAGQPVREYYVQIPRAAAGGPVALASLAAAPVPPVITYPVQGPQGPVGPMGATGPTGPAGAAGSTTLAALTDLTATGAAVGQVLAVTQTSGGAMTGAGLLEPSALLAPTMRPRSRPISRPQETVLSAFAAGHPWTVSGPWASSNLNDTSDAGWSSQVVSGVTDGVGGGCNFQNLAITAFDPAGKTFCIYMKASDPTKIGSVQLYLGTTSGMTNAVVLTALGGSGQMMLADEWYPVMFTYDASTVQGTGPGTAVTCARIRIGDRGGSAPITVKVGGLSYLPAPSQWPNGVVSLCFDDGWSSLISTVQPTMGKYRYRGTAFPILDLLGTAGYTTAAPLQQLEQKLYWEVGGHASTLANHAAGYPALSAAALEADLYACRKWLADNGFRGDVHAYPSGAYNLASVAATRRYFAASRTTFGSQKEVFPPADPMRIRSFSVIQTTTLATVQALIDSAQTYKHHLVLTFHDIVTSPAAGSVQWSTANFTSLIDYIATKSIAVRPLGEALAAA